MHENITRIKAVNEILKELSQDYVFVGGATVSLYVKDALENDIRPTKDVDIIVELATYKGYSELDERLREIGFKNDITSGVICRYNIQGITVDFMPTHPEAIGFSNRWYPEGFENAIEHPIDTTSTVKIFSLPYFIASKWEAFKGRGTDFRTSTDFEDLVYVFENVEDLQSQLGNAPVHLRNYLREEFSQVLDRNAFEEGLTAHLRGGLRPVDPEHIRNILRQSLDIPPPFKGYSR